MMLLFAIECNKAIVVVALCTMQTLAVIVPIAPKLDKDTYLLIQYVL